MKSVKKDACIQIGVDEALVQTDSTSESREWKFLEPNHFSDLQLVVGDKTFHCHKIMLANCSPVFNVMLSSDFLEKSSDKIEIKNIDPEAMEISLQSIYTPGFKCNSEKDALLILPIIDQYQISHIHKEIENKLYESLLLYNYKCVDFLRLARSYNLPKVRHTCLDIISRSPKHWTDLKNSEDLMDFENELLRARVQILEDQLKNIDLCLTNPCTKIEKKEIRVPVNFCTNHTSPFSTTENGDYCNECVKKMKLHIKNVCTTDKIKTTISHIIPPPSLTTATSTTSVNDNSTVAASSGTATTTNTNNTANSTE